MTDADESVRKAAYAWVAAVIDRRIQAEGESEPLLSAIWAIQTAMVTAAYTPPMEDTQNTAGAK